MKLDLRNHGTRTCAALVALTLALAGGAARTAAQPNEHAHAKAEAHAGGDDHTKEAREKAAQAKDDVEKAGKHVGEAMKAVSEEARDTMQKAHDDAHDAMKTAEARAKEIVDDAHERALEAMKAAHEAMGKAIGLEERGAKAAHTRHEMFLRMHLHHVMRPEDIPADVRTEQREHARRMARLARASVVAKEQKDDKSEARAQELMEHEIAHHTRHMDELWHQHDEEKKP
jgi:hypothetical protein